MIKISFLLVCLPDYFGGHHLPVLQATVDGATTRKELCESLIAELSEGCCDYTFQEQFGFELPYGEVRQAIEDCLFWNGDCMRNDILFPDMETGTEEDGTYAYFVVRWEEESE